MKIYRDYLECVNSANGWNEEKCAQKFLMPSDGDDLVSKYFKDLLAALYGVKDAETDSEELRMTNLERMALCMQVGQSEGATFAAAMENCVWSIFGNDVDVSLIEKRLSMTWSAYPSNLDTQLQWLRAELTKNCIFMIDPDLLN